MNANDLIRQAESFGFRLGYENGYTTAKMPAIGDPEELDGIARQLCKNLEAVARVTMERARAARAPEFAGRPAFATELQVLAAIESLSGRVATISYRSEEEGYATRGVEVESLLIAMPETEDSRPPSGFPVEMSDGLRLFIESIESSGVRFAFLDGFLIASSPGGGRDTLKTIKDLGEVPRAKSGRESIMVPANPWPVRMQGIRRLAIARARGLGGKDFVGSTAIANIDAFSTGLDPRATITRCGEDGMLVLSSYSELAYRPMEFQCSADQVLILRDAKQPEQREAAENEAEPLPGAAKRRWPFRGGQSGAARA